MARSVAPVCQALDTTHAKERRKGVLRQCRTCHHDYLAPSVHELAPSTSPDHR
jgi:hypothetical protein